MTDKKNTSPRSVNLTQADLTDAVADFVTKRYGEADGAWEAVFFHGEDPFATKLTFRWNISAEKSKP